MENINNSEDISLIDIMKILKKRIVFIVFIAVLCAGIMAVKSIFFSAHMYQAYTTAVIVKGDSSIIKDSQYTQNDVLLYQKIAETYIEIAKSNLVIDKTSEELKSYSPSQLRSMVTAVQMGDTQMIQLIVKGINRDVANIANVYCDNFIKESMRILPVGKIQVLDMAKITYQMSTNTLSNIGSGFLLGLLAAIGIVFFRNYIESHKIRNKKQVANILNIPVLVTIE
jgi:capsular polysaccharide biosynthesis protein